MTIILNHFYVLNKLYCLGCYISWFLDYLGRTSCRIRSIRTCLSSRYLTYLLNQMFLHLSINESLYGKKRKIPCNIVVVSYPSLSPYIVQYWGTLGVRVVQLLDALKLYLKSIGLIAFVPHTLDDF